MGITDDKAIILPGKFGGTVKEVSLEFPLKGHKSNPQMAIWHKSTPQIY